MTGYADQLKDSEILFIVRNGFVEPLEYPRHYLREQEVIDMLESEMRDAGHDNGIFRMTNTVFDWDESDADEYGRKYDPEDHYLTSFDIEKLADIEDFKTRSERRHIAVKNGKKRSARLDKWLSSFNTDEYRYTVGKTFGSNVCFYQWHGAGMFSQKHSFGDIKPTKANIEMIMKFIVGFLKEKHGIEADMDYAVIHGPERLYYFDDLDGYFSEEGKGASHG